MHLFMLILFFCCSDCSVCLKLLLLLWHQLWKLCSLVHWLLLWVLQLLPLQWGQLESWYTRMYCCHYHHWHHWILLGVFQLYYTVITIACSPQDRCLLLLRFMAIMSSVLQRWVLLFQTWASHWYFILLLWCLLSTFMFHCVYVLHEWETNHLGLHYCIPLEHIHGRHMSLLLLVLCPC